MKQFIKNNMIGFILGAIIFGGIGVYATQILAKDIKFTPTVESWKVDNIEDAINDLYTKKEQSAKTDGELFLDLLMKKPLTVSHNYASGYTAVAKVENLNFSNIRSIEYEFNINVNKNAAQVFFLYDNVKKTYIIYQESAINDTIEINGAEDVTFELETSYSGANTFKVISYETMDGVIHK